MIIKAGIARLWAVMGREECLAEDARPEIPACREPLMWDYHRIRDQSGVAGIWADNPPGVHSYRTSIRRSDTNLRQTASGGSK